MDGDSYKKQSEGEEPIQPRKAKAKSTDRVSCLSNLLQPSWVRCPISSDNELDRILLDYGCHFLCPFAIFLWALFFIFQMFG